MKLKHLLISLSLGLATGFSNYALAFEAPQNCPSASDIKSIGIKNVIADPNRGDYYAGYSTHRYNTTNTWLFVIANIKSDSQANAFVGANNALPSLAGTPDPIPYDNGKEWICLYSINSGYVAAAITPIPSVNQAASALAR